jgi:competence protein ComEA
MKNKGLAIAAVIGVAAAYIVVFNAVSAMPKAELPSVNTVYYGGEYIAAGENNGVQTVYTGNAYEETSELYTETAYDETAEPYTEFAYDESSAVHTETAYEKPHTETAYDETSDAYTINAYSETANPYTETAYGETTSAYTETAYEETTAAYTETVSELINLNTATLDELITLDGIGEVIAGRIIEYRNTYGFRSVEELKNIKGIGDVKYAKIVSRVTV